LPIALLSMASPQFLPAQNYLIYTDSLQNSWNDWSYFVTRDFNNTAFFHSGTASIAVTLNTGTAWGALSLEHDAPVDTSPYTDLTFWINGGSSGGQQLQVYAELSSGAKPAVALPTLTTNWQQITLSLASLGVANQPNFVRFSIQDRSGLTSVPTYYVDDIMLVTNAVPPPGLTLTAPSNGATFLAPANITLSATVTTNSHTINQVQFYNGSTLLATDPSPPYTATWTNVPAGSYSLFARVTYDGSSTRDSATASVSVFSNTPVTISVDAQLNRHAISPLIYGVAFASSNQLADLNFTMNRSGGNAETRYNWLTNAHNRGGDWYFESIGDNPATPAAAADDFVANSKNGGGQAMLTIPMIGWAPKLATNRGNLASYSIAKYGPQTGNDYWMPDAGTGIGTNTTNHTSWLITTNEPTDANFATNSTFQQAFIQHLTNRWGLSTNAGVRYYLMDNEHSIWFSTHRDVHPVGPTMQEIRDKFFDYASVVKAVDPNALVLAPEEWGWGGYFFSGYDQQNSGNHDRNNNGGWDYCPWLLNQFHQRDTNTNQRLLDYFTLHCYPQGGEGGSDVSTATQLLRNRSTRQLWDTNYVDQSWIGQQPANNILMLIPRMKNWVATYYPGTKIGITEYNWGAEGNINGATAQADVLGIFGREGLDLATRWTAVATTDVVHKAMRMYRNYDNNKSTFGDTSVNAAGPNPDNVSVFAAVRSSDGALTIMVINKQLLGAALSTINLAHFVPAGTAQVWQLTAANTITRLSDLSLTGATLSNSLPAQSITLYVVPAAVLAGPASNPNPANGATGVTFTPSLTWTAGSNAVSHLVYFGANSNAVATVSTNAPEFKGSFNVQAYSPGTLASSGRFYWRVDETAGANINPGLLWSFATAIASSNTFQFAGHVGGGGNFVVSFPSQVGQTYRVERTDGLSPATWNLVTNGVPGTGGTIQILDPGVPSQPQRFYRVILLSP